MKMEQTIESKNPLGTEPVGKLLLQFSVPGIICMVVNALYNIVDQVFIGRGIGYLGNGATNVIMPMTVIALALALMLGDGAAAYLSLKLGANEPEHAAEGVGGASVFLVIVGVILAAIYLIFTKPLCMLFGATSETLPYALDYGRIIAIGLPFSCISVGYSGVIRADGSPKFSMAGLLAGSVINLICDPLFIFVFKWGIKGAAIATILGQFVNAAMCVWYYIFRLRHIRLKKEYLRPRLKAIEKICSMGVSSFITQMSIVLVMAVSNNLLVKYGAMSIYGAEIPMTTMGITMKVNQIMIAVVIGLATGAQPIFGFNYGSGQTDRVKKTLKITLIIADSVLICAFLLFQFAPMSVVSIFGSESQLYNEFAVKCMRTFLMLCCINGFQLVSGIFFQAIGKPAFSAILSLSRQVLFLIPAMFILPTFMGVEGVLWAGPVADGMAFILAITLLTINLRKLK